MLVLTRKKGESFELANGMIKITVVSINGHGKVRIGIDAPKDIDVKRSELPGGSDHVSQTSVVIDVKE